MRFAGPVALVGECMVELRHTDPTTLRLGYAGDTLNTAVYLARTWDGDVHYVTAVGDDSYSDAMVAGWIEEGIDVEHVARVAGAHPGLYLVHTDERGERTFTYYRSQSPARRLFSDVDPLGAEGLSRFGVVYLSGITLSLLTDAARQRLWSLLDKLRAAGGTVVFDTNYRPAGWPDVDTARDTIAEMLRRTDIAMPTFGDEQVLSGDADAAACTARLHALGVTEVVVKLDADGCLVNGEHVPALVVDDVVDTTAAGDSFNAAYLAARLQGASPPEAAVQGHRLAAEVIRHGGAIIPRTAMPT